MTDILVTYKNVYASTNCDCPNRKARLGTKVSSSIISLDKSLREITREDYAEQTHWSYGQACPLRPVVKEGMYYYIY